MNKLISRTKYLIVNTIYKIIYKKPLVMSDEETINYIINNDCSVSRFGDGELLIINDNSITWFQDSNKELKNRLIEIANQSNEKLLVCIPNIFSNEGKRMLTKKSLLFWNRHLLLYGGYYYYFFNNQVRLGDASFTRFYLGKKDKESIPIYVSKLRKLWNNKNLLIVEGYNTKLGIGNDLFDNSCSIRRILCPNKNAFNSYQNILNSVIKHYKKDDLVLIALGPTATVLAYDLSVKYGIRSLDVGHIDIEYMWYLNKSKDREDIEGKNSAEFDSQEYNSKDIVPNTIEIIK